MLNFALGFLAAWFVGSFVTYKFESSILNEKYYYIMAFPAEIIIGIFYHLPKYLIEKKN